MVQPNCRGSNVTTLFGLGNFLDCKVDQTYNYLAMIGRVERRGMELHGAWPGVGTEQREEPGLVQAGGAGPNYCDNGTKENGHATVLT